jgi:hypothetical protein
MLLKTQIVFDSYIFMSQLQNSHLIELHMKSKFQTFLKYTLSKKLYIV